MLFSEDNQLEESSEQLIYLQSEELPKTIYKNQILKINYSAIIAAEFDNINTEFHSFDDVKILTPYASWKTDSVSKYSLVLYVEVTGNKPKFPNLTLTIKTKDGLTSNETINGKFRTSYNIANEKDYIQVVGNSFKVLSHKVEKYNEESNILTLSLEGNMANLQDINISFATNQGFDKIENKYPSSKILYYAVVPNFMKTVNLLTFNPIKATFESHDIKLDFSNIGQRVSTQVDINPNKRSFPILEMLIIGFIIVFSLLLLIKTRHWIFLVIIALLILYASWILLKEDNILIKSGSNIFLLPIKNSTLFMTTDRPMNVVKLKAKGDYIKVILPNKNIGWVKKDNVSSF